MTSYSQKSSEKTLLSITHALAKGWEKILEEKGYQLKDEVYEEISQKHKAWLKLTTPAVLSKMLLVFSKYYEEEVAVEMSMYLSSEFKKSDAYYCVNLSHPFLVFCEQDAREELNILNFKGHFETVSSNIHLCHFDTVKAAKDAKNDDFKLEKCTKDTDELLPPCDTMHVAVTVSVFNVGVDQIDECKQKLQQAHCDFKNFIQNIKAAVNAAEIEPGPLKKLCLEAEGIADSGEKELGILCTQMTKSKYNEDGVTSNIVARLEEFGAEHELKVFSKKSNFGVEKVQPLSRFANSRPDIAVFNAKSRKAVIAMGENWKDDEYEQIDEEDYLANEMKSFNLRASGVLLEGKLPKVKTDPELQLLGETEKFAGDLARSRIEDNDLFKELLIYALAYNIQKDTCKVRLVNMDFCNKTSFVFKGRTDLTVCEGVNRAMNMLL